MRRRVAAAVLAISVSLTMTACATDGAGTRGRAAAFSAGVTVAEDADGSGIETSRLLLDAAPVVVVAAPDPAAQAAAASAAVALRAPMLTAVPGAESALADEVGRLDAAQVLRVGGATFDADGIEVIDAPSDPADLGEFLGVDLGPTVDVSEDTLGRLVADRESGTPVLFAAGEVSGGAGTDRATGGLEQASPVWSGEEAPSVLVTDSTPTAAVATAVAVGVAVVHVPLPDPRATGASVEAVTRSDAVYVLGPEWAAEGEVTDLVEQARTVPQLPGGGQLVFPGRRFVAAYGSPITPTLGILGEQGPEESVVRVQELVEQYRPFSQEPVVPAFEIIGTVASGDPGDDGNFTNEWAPEVFAPLVDAITAAGGYAVIDLQPGMADLLDQAKLFEDLLTRPGVGLALDPEWKLQPGQRPGSQIGSVDADEINRVVTWLADLTRDSGGPQKLLILHQFSTDMISGRERIDTSRPELAIALHADGHGTPDLKLETWDRLRAGLSPDIWVAWKNFYDEDTPMFTPEETMAVRPRPWFVSYQ